MKNVVKYAVALVALLAATPAFASHAQEGWYAGLGAGANFSENTGTHNTGIPAFKFNPGWDALGSVGYGYGNGIRTEGEVFHSQASVDKSNGSLRNTDLFANAFYDFDLGMGLPVTPYVGAGVGVAFVDADNIGPYGAAVRTDGSDTQFAYQGIAGLAAQIDPNWTVSADYRYIASLDPSISNTAGVSHRIDNASHNVIVGLRYNFDAPEVVPVRSTKAPAVRSAPKAEVEPVGDVYQVFFDFNKSVLTPEAKSIIASAADAFKKGGAPRIVVTGHTDTKGSDKYNIGLSNRRAAAVKKEFVRLGVPAKAIATQGLGKDGQLVPTNDQVREAQNRRAEIVLAK